MQEGDTGAEEILQLLLYVEVEVGDLEDMTAKQADSITTTTTATATTILQIASLDMQTTLRRTPSLLHTLITFIAIAPKVRPPSHY